MMTRLCYITKTTFDDNDDDNDSEQQNAANTKTSAEVIAGTNHMNDTPIMDGEISKDMTAEPIKSDATEKKRKSLKDLKETTPPKKRGQGK